ncbi:hypothetical protein ACF0H5_008887 [Mactra antiquata]
MNTTVVCFLALFAFGSAAVLHLEKKDVGPVPRHYMTERIINGDQASPGEFPHQVTLLRNGYHTCGGSVIGTGHALTAAHCVDGQAANSLAVVVDLHNFNNPGNYIWFDIDGYTMHESYNTGPGAFPNDVAVLHLTANGFNIAKNIITLAQGSQTYAEQTCTITGWGVTETGSGSSVLMKADVRVLSNSECTNTWGNNIVSQHICVIGEVDNGQGSCNGDSGGPLVCNNNSVLVGVTSWGRSGCHVNGVVTHPSVYARVTSFNSWIRSTCGGCQ